MAERLDLTIRTIEGIQAPAAGRVDFKDSKVPGLYLRVTSNGVKTFSFLGRAKGASRIERLTIGKFPIVKPEEARRRATELAGQLAGGISVAASSRQRRGEMTMAELYKLYHEHLVRTTKKPENAANLWDRYIAPEFGNRKLSEVSALDLERWHAALPGIIVKRRADASAARAAAKAAQTAAAAERRSVRRRGPVPAPAVPAPAATKSAVTGKRTANLAIECLRAMFNFAREPKRAYFTGDNPARDADMYANVERERFLQPAELQGFFLALSEVPNDAMRDFILLALLTGARRANVVSMRWADINLEAAEWRVRGELMKNDQPQTITLTPEAVAILRGRQGRVKSPFVLASSRSKSGHIEDPRAAWEQVMKSAKLSDLRIHDLRRTLGSWQARTGASLVMVGKSLNHKDTQSTAIYARLDLDPVRQSVDRATSAMFEAAGLKPAAEVHELRPGRSGQAEGGKKAARGGKK